MHQSPKPIPPQLELEAGSEGDASVKQRYENADIHYEPDERHVEAILETMGLNKNPGRP